MTTDVEPTSEGQFEAWSGGAVPAPERVRPDLWSLPSPMPDFRMRYALIWANVDPGGAVHLVDAGLDSAANRDLLAAQLEQIAGPGARVATVAITHLHRDHVGMSDWLRETYGATVVMGAGERTQTPGWVDPDVLAATLERWQVPDGERARFTIMVRLAEHQPVVDRFVRDGDVVATAGRTLRVVETPGHTGGHVVYVDDERRQVHTGDHVLPNAYPGIALGAPTPTNPLEDYLMSCRAMEAFSGHEALPGHGYRFTGLAERARASAGHQLRRVGQVAEVLRTAPSATVWETAGRLTWGTPLNGLAVPLQFSALIQTEVLMTYVRDRHPNGTVQPR